MMCSPPWALAQASASLHEPSKRIVDWSSSVTTMHPVKSVGEVVIVVVDELVVVVEAGTVVDVVVELVVVVVVGGVLHWAKCEPGWWAQ